MLLNLEPSASKRHSTAHPVLCSTDRAPQQPHQRLAGTQLAHLLRQRQRQVLEHLAQHEAWREVHPRGQVQRVDAGQPPADQGIVGITCSWPVLSAMMLVIANHMSCRNNVLARRKHARGGLEGAAVAPVRAEQHNRLRAVPVDPPRNAVLNMADRRVGILRRAAPDAMRLLLRNDVQDYPTIGSGVALRTIPTSRAAISSTANEGGRSAGSVGGWLPNCDVQNSLAQCKSQN